MKLKVRKVLFGIFLILSTIGACNAQVTPCQIDSLKVENIYKTVQQHESRLNSIDTTLKGYGKQNVITDKITLGSIAIVIVGTALNAKPGPMLVANSLCSLAILTISYKADLNLSKHKKEPPNQNK